MCTPRIDDVVRLTQAIPELSAKERRSRRVKSIWSVSFHCHTKWSFIRPAPIAARACSCLPINSGVEDLSARQGRVVRFGRTSSAKCASSCGFRSETATQNHGHFG